jgi:hypothetical protein
MKHFFLALLMAFISTAAFADHSGHTGYPYSMKQHDYFGQPRAMQQQATSREMCELCSCKDVKDVKKAAKMNCCKDQCSSSKALTGKSKTKSGKMKEAVPASGDKEQQRY